MVDITLLLPLIIIFAGALLALAFRSPTLNRLLTITQLSWLLALAPLAAFVLLVLRIPGANEGLIYTWQWEWLPSLGLQLGFYVDSLSIFFGLIVTFIGILVIVYGGQYFKGDQSAWRFQTYMLLFMGSMLGLVMAGDVLTLFIFWEGTSIVSYLLVAYKTKDEAARAGGFQALFITGGGGIALLAGLLVVSAVVGSTDLATILRSGDLLRGDERYLLMLALVTFGAFTKSAQFPAHIWLPRAMSAPTPASAYLHSATMVKAGIYLLARMNPALGGTETWFWLLTIVGGVTMLAGAYLGLKQNDLKALLAYSTISQLGVLTLLIGQNSAAAFKALVVGILAHALYKSALFLVAGIVDHEAGTRDLRRLGGLRRVMPFTFAVGALAAFSMAGLPPMFGFLAKETLLITAVEAELSTVMGLILRTSVVLAGALILAQAGLLIWETFMGRAKDTAVHAHEAPWPMFLAPALPAALSLIFSLLPGPKEEAPFLGGAASAAFGDTVKVSTALFHGFTLELALSIVAITLGVAIFLVRQRVRAVQDRIAPNLTFERLYQGTLATLDLGSYWATRLQTGHLRTYLTIIVISTVGLSAGLAFTNPSSLTFPSLSWSSLTLTGDVIILNVLALLTVVGASAMSVLLRRDFNAILALSAAGLGVALLYALEPAPDVALVQIVVDILAMVILVLALTRLPRGQRRKAQELTDTIRKQLGWTVWRDVVVATAVGLLVGLFTLSALTERPRTSIGTPYYAANAKTLTGASDIVGAIVVDFRALDTVLEITVFGMAGIGIYTLLRYATKKHGDVTPPDDRPPLPQPLLKTYGIAGRPTSSFMRVPVYAILPLAMILAITHIMYGHDQPGDGFTGGVIISLAVALWYVAFGFEETNARLPWLRAWLLVSSGVLLVLGTGTVAAFLTGSFLGNYDFTANWTFLPAGFHISTSFLFELSICLTVLGSAVHMLNSLGHPGTTTDD
jgi:NADH:ubiquinone oxidoreductase subunit 5 (subunit L)/multisubunit Na+/H+ antiporter MnhA subunit/multisubunit Na+/H+ antiporter MnhB subunit